MKPRLLEKYNKDVVSEMMSKFGYKNRLEVPVINKIVVNMGVGIGADAQGEVSLGDRHLFYRDPTLMRRRGVGTGFALAQHPPESIPYLGDKILVLHVARRSDDHPVWQVVLVHEIDHVPPSQHSDGVRLPGDGSPQRMGGPGRGLQQGAHPLVGRVVPGGDLA